MSLLTLSNVSYYYNNSETPAVADVSCSFDPGKLYAIVGPSGSGKSTLLSMMAGLTVRQKVPLPLMVKTLRILTWINIAVKAYR